MSHIITKQKTTSNVGRGRRSSINTSSNPGRSSIIEFSGSSIVIPENESFWSELKDSANSEISHDAAPDLGMALDSFVENIAEQSAAVDEMKHQQQHQNVDDMTTIVHWIIHPFNPTKLKWDVFVGLIVVFAVLIVPWKVGFNVPSTNMWIGLDIFADSIFLIDMILTFNTGYFEDAAEEVYISARKQIAMQYLQTWFLIDMLSTVPFDYIAAAGNGSGDTSTVINVELRLTKLVRGLRLFRLAKIATMTVKISRLHKAAAHHYDINPAIAPLVKMLCFIVYSLHILCCGWYFVCTLDEESMRDNWVEKVRREVLTGKENWSTEAFTWYFYSLYWAASTMFAVGYGDIHPVNSTERLYALVTQVLGAMAYGYIIGTISYLTEVASPRASALAKRTNELKDWMSVRQLPRNLRTQIISHMKYVWNFRTLYNETLVLENLSGDLRRRLVFQSYEQVIMSVRLLRWKGVDGRMIELVATNCKPQLLKVGDYLVRKGDIVHGLYIVREGHLHGLKCDNKNEYGNYVEGRSGVGSDGVGSGGVGSDGVGSGGVGSSGVEGESRERAERSALPPTTSLPPTSPLGMGHVQRRSSLGMKRGTRMNDTIFCAEDGHSVLESDVLLNNLSHQHQYHCVATSICDIILIPKSTIYHIRSHYPDFFRKFCNIAKERKKMMEIVETSHPDPLGRGPSILLINGVLVPSTETKHLAHIKLISELDKKTTADNTSTQGRRDSFRVVASNKSIMELKTRLKSAKDATLVDRQMKEKHRHMIKLKRLDSVNSASAATAKTMVRDVESGNTDEMEVQKEEEEEKRGGGGREEEEEQEREQEREQQHKQQEKEDKDHNDNDEESMWTTTSTHQISSVDTERALSMLNNKIEVDEFFSENTAIDSPQDLLHMWIIHPTLPSKMIWDVTVAVLILYSVIVIPYRICFEQDSEGLVAIFDWFVDVMFALDLFLCFRTAYFLDDGRALVIVPKLIRLHYLKSWFMVDFMSTVPFDKVVAAFLPEKNNGIEAQLRSIRLIKSLRLFRLIKMVRVIKLGKITESIKDILNFSPATFRLISLTLQVVFFSHLVS